MAASVHPEADHAYEVYEIPNKTFKQMPTAEGQNGATSESATHPNSSGKWNQAVGNVSMLSKTLRELETLHTDKETNAMRKQLVCSRASMQSRQCAWVSRPTLKILPRKVQAAGG